MLLSLKCRLYSERGQKHAPCSGTTDDGTERPCECRCHAGRRYPGYLLNPAGYLEGLRWAMGPMTLTWSDPPDPDDYDPVRDDPPFTLIRWFTVAGNAIRCTGFARYPLETFGMSTACSGAELARAACGEPVRGCSPSPLSSSIRQG